MAHPPTGSTVPSPRQLALNVVTLIVLAIDGFLGGRLAYRYRVRVADERTQATGFTR